MDSLTAGTIQIKGTTYAVLPIDPHDSGIVAYRLAKQGGKGEVYDVIRTHEGLIRCDCPSYTFHHEGTASLCKHGVALVHAGLLDLPAMPVERPESEPEPGPGFDAVPDDVFLDALVVLADEAERFLSWDNSLGDLLARTVLELAKRWRFLAAGERITAIEYLAREAEQEAWLPEHRAAR